MGGGYTFVYFEQFNIRKSDRRECDMPLEGLVSPNQYYTL